MENIDPRSQSPTAPPASPVASAPAPAAAPPPPQATAPSPPTAPPTTAPPPPTPTAPVASPAQPPPFRPDPTPRVVNTDKGSHDGLAKCERCGATEIGLNVASGLLRCNFCRHEWSTERVSETFRSEADIGRLSGIVIGSGSTDIVPSAEQVLTFKCSACGAEVVIDTRNSTQARCHWCRNKLSTNTQVPNGAVPDMVLPFSMTKDAAVAAIAAFVGKRKFFAHPKFREEFNAENVMGVYLPYMVVDINAHAGYIGQGEHLTRSYNVKRGDDTESRYDADLYDIERDFDLHIKGLTVESSSERRDQNVLQNTNNIINTIMPFDVENAVRYDSNYLAGFTSERRDSNVEDLSSIVQTQAEDVSRHSILKTLGFYDRGVRWGREHVDMRGQRWVAAYLPVWLYSYHEEKPNGGSFLHYVAVNGRTGETMGSVPLHQKKLLLTAGAVQVAGTIVFAIFQIFG